MARVSCRCGEALDYDPYGPERIVCPRCGSKVRVRRRIPGASPSTAPSSSPDPDVIEIEDGYIRFFCPCGRRLKIKTKGRPEAGKCPDCGRVVPVPDPSAPQPSRGSSAGQGPDGQRTGEMSAEDVARINTWSQHWQARKGDEKLVAAGRPDEGKTPAGVPVVRANVVAPPSAVKMEAGLRVCPRCGKPVHLGAANCRECGAAVPKR